MDKENEIYLYNRMLFILKKEGSTSNAIACLNKHLKHYAKWKKQVTKENILYDFIYMYAQNRQNQRDRK